MAEVFDRTPGVVAAVRVCDRLRPFYLDVFSGRRRAGAGARARMLRGPGRGSLSHDSDTPRHFWRQSGIFRVILPVLSMGLAPYVREGYHPARMIPGRAARGGAGGHGMSDPVAICRT